MWILIYKENAVIEHEVQFNNIEDAKQELTNIRKYGLDGFIFKNKGK